MKNDSLRTNLPVDHFALVVEKAKAVSIYSDNSSITDFGNENI